MQPSRFSLKNFGARLGAAMGLVFATYNATGLSYYHWALTSLADVTAFQVIVGLALIIGWVVFIRATVRSLGPVGIALIAALFAAIFWMIVGWGIISADNMTSVVFMTQIVLCFILAIGMSWSHVRRRLSGQVDGDDIGD